MTRETVADSGFPPQAPAPEPFSRAVFRAAVADVSARAKATLPPAVNGRVEKAVQIVLSGDVEVMPDGSIMVGSQSDAAKCYYLVDGACDCPDSARADIEGWCKHRIAVAIWKRAVPLAQEKLESQHAPSAPQAALPEAPASANCHVMLAGRQVQLTLRDSDETRLLARLDALLKRFPADDTPPADAPREGWCPVHRVSMKKQTNAKGSWWSHHTGEKWCKGR